MKYLLLDANNILCRSHYATKLTDSKGRSTSGVFGVMRTIKSLIKKFNPDKAVVVWDQGKCERRIKIYPEYKAQRNIKKNEKSRKIIHRQRKICQELFAMLPVKQLSSQGIEADDIIGILCEKLNGKKIIVSNDQDFYQLIASDVQIFNSNSEHLINRKNIDKILGFPLKYYLLYKSIVGDSSDNIKGIPGLGPVKTKKLINDVLRSGKKLPIKSEEQEILDRNKYLISIGAMITKDEIKKIKKQYRKEHKKEIDYEEVQKQFAKLNFKTLYYNFSEWAYWLKKLR